MSTESNKKARENITKAHMNAFMVFTDKVITDKWNRDQEGSDESFDEVSHYMEMFDFPRKAVEILLGATTSEANAVSVIELVRRSHLLEQGNACKAVACLQDYMKAYTERNTAAIAGAKDGGADCIEDLNLRVMAYNVCQRLGAQPGGSYGVEFYANGFSVNSNNWEVEMLALGDKKYKAVCTTNTKPGGNVVSSDVVYIERVLANWLWKGEILEKPVPKDESEQCE